MKASRKESVAALLLCLPAICSSQYIRLPVNEAFATATSKQGKLILSDQQKNCAAGNLFALLIADEYLNHAGCWFYDAPQDTVYVKFAGEHQHKSYPAGAFKLMRESGEGSFRGMANGWTLTPEQKRQERNARSGKLDGK